MLTGYQIHAGWQGGRTCTPTNLETLPSSVLMGVIVSRFQNGVPFRLRQAKTGDTPPVTATLHANDLHHCTSSWLKP